MSARAERAPRVLSVLSVFGHGRGGHYYDAVTVATALRGRCSTGFLTIGRGESPVVAASGQPREHVRLAGASDVVPAVRAVLGIVRCERPDVVHSYDLMAAGFARLAALRLSARHVHTKCGGPNPTGRFPAVESLIVVSGENRDYFEPRPRFRNTRVVLLPNRVTTPEQDRERMESFRAEHGLGDRERRILLRIGRISREYETGIRQSIRLAEGLRSRGVPCTLVVIGTADDPGLVREIAAEGAVVSSDPRYTLNAARLIDLADCVIGTGRGVMEAASLGKVLLTDLAEGPYPALVTESNWSALFYTNFSPRNRLPDGPPGPSYVDEVAARLRGRARGERDPFALRLFRERFDVDLVADDYLDLYGSTKPARWSPGAAADVVQGIGYGLKKSLAAASQGGGRQ